MSIMTDHIESAANQMASFFALMHMNATNYEAYMSALAWLYEIGYREFTIPKETVDEVTEREERMFVKLTFERDADENLVMRFEKQIAEEE